MRKNILVLMKGTIYLWHALGGWLGVEKNKLKLQTDVNALKGVGMCVHPYMQKAIHIYTIFYD